MHKNRSTYKNLREIAERKAVLNQLAPLVNQMISIPGTDVTLDVLLPVNIDVVMENIPEDPQENLPYWAEIWPSGIALAAEVLLRPSLVAGKPVVELGSGVGVTAAAAMLAGAQLLATDYSPHSLLLTELTCLRAGLGVPTTRIINWRDPAVDFVQDSGEQWPVVIAADVLYESRDIQPILDVCRRILAPGGTVLLAEPGRHVAQTAIRCAREQGWQIGTRRHSGPWPDQKDKDVVVSVHTMQHRTKWH